VYWWTFWKAADELIEKLLGAYLEMKRVSAILNANVKELCIGELSMFFVRSGAIVHSEQAKPHSDCDD
jgi:hypothetical protein